MILIYKNFPNTKNTMLYIQFRYKMSRITAFPTHLHVCIVKTQISVIAQSDRTV